MSSTPTQVAPPRRQRTGKPFVLPNWVYTVGVVLLVIAFLGGLTMLFGRVSGEEFSPHDFQRRTFSYYELPVIGVQVWPVKRFDATGDVETEIVTKKLITVTKPKDPRWDLVLGYRGSAQVADGDANILVRYLDRSTSTGGRTWLNWTTEKPKLAKVFWPWIAKLAQQELYLFMPDLFELAAAASEAKTEDVTAFEAELQRLLAQKYHDFGIAQQKLQQHENAIMLLDEALKLVPEQKDWAKELEASRQALPVEKDQS
jgi:hypothetical protein